MEQKKLAVIFPGIGYHKDKPLLYYAGRLAKSAGYDMQHIEFHDMPQKIRGNAAMMQTAAALAIGQAAEQLRDTDWSAYSEILLIGKSIGTIAAARYAAESHISTKQIWYTPLNATFSDAAFPPKSCIAFLGKDDPWSDISKIRADAEKQQIPLYLYPECNHSLESPDVLQNIRNLSEIMQITSDFIQNTN